MLRLCQVRSFQTFSASEVIFHIPLLNQLQRELGDALHHWHDLAVRAALGKALSSVVQVLVDAFDERLVAVGGFDTLAPHAHAVTPAACINIIAGLQLRAPCAASAVAGGGRSLPLTLIRDTTEFAVSNTVVVAFLFVALVGAILVAGIWQRQGQWHSGKQAQQRENEACCTADCTQHVTPPAVVCGVETRVAQGISGTMWCTGT